MTGSQYSNTFCYQDTYFCILNNYFVNLLKILFFMALYEPAKPIIVSKPFRHKWEIEPYYCEKKEDNLSQYMKKQKKTTTKNKEKTDEITCDSREGSAQTGPVPSLIRTFVVCMNKAWLLLSAHQRLIRLESRFPDWSQSPLIIPVILLTYYTDPVHWVRVNYL